MERLAAGSRHTGRLSPPPRSLRERSRFLEQTDAHRYPTEGDALRMDTVTLDAATTDTHTDERDDQRDEQRDEQRVEQRVEYDFVIAANRLPVDRDDGHDEGPGARDEGLLGCLLYTSDAADE